MLLRRLALALPEVVDTGQGERVLYEVAGRKICWSWKERIHPRKPRVTNPGVAVIRTTLERKQLLMEAAPDRFFEDAHYRGFPAILVRLDVVSEVELASLLTEAWDIEVRKLPAEARRALLLQMPTSGDTP